MRIFVAGHITVDEIVFSSRTLVSLGGPPSYTGLTLYSLGVKPYAISAVGGDFPLNYWEFLREYVDLSHVSIVPGAETTRFKLVYNGERRELYLLKRCVEILSFPEGIEYIHVSPVAQEFSTEVLKKSYEFLSLDPQGYLRRFDERGKVVLFSNKELLKSLCSVNHFRVSLREAKALFGDSWFKYLRKLSAKGTVVSLGLGNRGVVVFCEKGEYYIPAYPTTAEQSTGAGDAYAGGFIYTYLTEEDVLWASAVGCAAASLMVEKPGPHIIDRNEVIERSHLIYSRHHRILSEEVLNKIAFIKVS
ncbi:MAG: hypothetical protein DRJ52_08225 [Thermoprotei archaeon]|mgnify:CR=1 FL=1|nr:MAG: hypothetical protein DRJ52_08225 [Thermoprotei archaeon]RLE99183.1 MAG: hypothetical protein DRJ63_06140 [Thermoprotei archaeon]HDI74628.1 hypothetical protein [Thermoprotei archaeon]